MNRLAGEPSAYLRQHAENPVHWQPFDDAAFAEAVARDVPIFLSVGYAACHWCHVMAGESFEDPAIGDYLNRHFVAIKVDREERPDVDGAYMAATQALCGEGGWPMSVFLTPDGRAFYAGTYFPPRPVTGRPSFGQVLEAVEQAWRLRRDQVEQTASDLAGALAQPLWRVHATAAAAVETAAAAVELETPQEPDRLGPAEQALAAMARAEDVLHGGLGAAPKFPPTPGLEFLLRLAASGTESAAQASGLAGRTLGAMVHSALFDQLSGGFARYSVTADWSEPHYEKMLYDNAGLLLVLVHWVRLQEAGSESGAVSGGEAVPEGKLAEKSGAVSSPGAVAPLASLSAAGARDAATATVGWLLAEMRLPGGAFASSLDADTVIDGVHHEGASYQWGMTELESAARAVAGDEPAALDLAAAVAQAMGVGTGTPARPGGQFPLHPSGPLSPLQRRQWEQLKPELLRRRALRVMPGRDEKVVAGWNAMLMRALAEAAMVLEEPAWLAAAVELGEYLRGVHWDGTLSRVSHDGRARGIKGLLEDYAACAQGFMTLYAATAETRWIEFAGDVVQAAEQEFIADGVVFNHGVDPAGVLVQGSRFADPFDNATAAGVALLAEAFTTWSAYTGSARHRAMAESMLANVPELAKRAPRAAGGMLGAALGLAAGPLEIAIVGVPGERRDALVRAAWKLVAPGIAIAVWDGVGTAPVALLEGRSLAGRHCAKGVGPAQDEPLAYVCRNMVCARPVATVPALRALLS